MLFFDGFRLNLARPPSTRGYVLIRVRRRFFISLDFFTFLVMNTLRNSGHKLNLSYFVDESFVKADEETVRAFVKTQPGILDYDLAARFVMQCRRRAQIFEPKFL